MGLEDCDTEEALIARVLAGSEPAAEAAFSELYQRHAPIVLAFLKRLYGHDHHGAHDALQETFLRGFRALSAFKRGRELRPWLLTIARNIAFDDFKRAGRAEQPHEQDALTQLARAPGSAPWEDVSVRELKSLIDSLVSKLEADERAIFFLKREAELSFAEAADTLGCSIRTAKYRMRSALEKLGAALERLGLEVRKP